MIGLFVLLAASTPATAGSFKAQMDVDTYVDANNANQSFSDADALWASSAEDKPVKEIYLSFVNNFGTVGVFKPEKIESATLTLNAVKVEKPGEIKAYLVHGATFDTATWMDKPDYESSVSASLNIDKESSYTLDVTPLIKKAVETCTEGCPYSIVLVAEGGASVGFASSKASKENKPSLEYVTAE